MVETHNYANPVLEQMRLLHSHLALKLLGATHRIIAVTSPGIGDGTAINMALEGERTMLVDANLRHATLHDSNASGLMSIIIGNAAMVDTLLSTSIEGVTLLPAGPTECSLNSVLLVPVVERQSTVNMLNECLTHRLSISDDNSPPGW